MKTYDAASYLFTKYTFIYFIKFKYLNTENSPSNLHISVVHENP